MLQNDTDRRKGYIAAIFFCTGGVSFLGIKICQQYTDGLSLLCYRYDFALAAVIILLVMKAVKIDIRRKPKGNSS